MNDGHWETNCWYWVRRTDGALAPYRLHRIETKRGIRCGLFYVGSMLQSFPLSQVMGKAHMPELDSRLR